MAAPAKEETRRDSSYRTNDRNSDKGEVGWFKSTQAAHSTSYWWHPGNSEPTTLLQHLRSRFQRREILPLCRPCFITVFLRVQIERRLNLAVTQDALHGFRFDFRFAHQPVAG